MKLEEIEMYLKKSKDKYDTAIMKVEKILSDKIDFEFDIFYQPGDGFVIHDSDIGNAPLAPCLVVIHSKGKLSEDDYRSLTI